MAGPTGFEPATSRLTIWRPNLAERRPPPGHMTLLGYTGSIPNVVGSAERGNPEEKFFLWSNSQAINKQLVGGTGIEPVTSAL